MKRKYTILNPQQRLMVAQIIMAFPDAKFKDIATVAGVSAGTITNVAADILPAVNFVKE